MRDGIFAESFYVRQAYIVWLQEGDVWRAWRVFIAAYPASASLTARSQSVELEFAKVVHSGPLFSRSAAYAFAIGAAWGL